MGTQEGLRIVGTLIGGGFLFYAVISVFRGKLYDSDDGWIHQARRPVAFWLSVFGMVFLGLLILGIAYRWPVVVALFRLTGGRL